MAGQVDIARAPQMQADQPGLHQASLMTPLEAEMAKREISEAFHQGSHFTAARSQMSQPITSHIENPTAAKSALESEAARRQGALPHLPTSSMPTDLGQHISSTFGNQPLMNVSGTQNPSSLSTMGLDNTLSGQQANPGSSTMFYQSQQQPSSAFAGMSAAYGQDPHMTSRPLQDPTVGQQRVPGSQDIQQGITEEKLQETAANILSGIPVNPTNLSMPMNISSTDIWSYGDDDQKPPGRGNQ